MPGPLYAWYSLYDLDALAEREAVLSGEIELRQLTRLREVLHSDRGSLQARLKFHRQTNRSVSMDLALETTLELICQRCLEPMVHRVSEQSSLTLLAPESMKSKVAEEGEAVVLTNGRLNPAALIEDELIVSLPIIPRHADLNECGTMVQTVQALAPDERSGIIDPPLGNR